jgi:hypothetical protein
MGRRGYPTISGMVFGLIAVGQGIRAAMQVPVQVGTTSISVWVVWVALVVAGGLSVWAFRSSAEHHRTA